MLLLSLALPLNITFLIISGHTQFSSSKGDEKGFCFSFDSLSLQKFRKAQFPLFC